MATQEGPEQRDVVAERSLPGSAALDIAMAFAGGFGATTGKVVADQIVSHVTRPKDETPKIELPKGVSKD
jgi:hypothetical protein